MNRTINKIVYLATYNNNIENIEIMLENILSLVKNTVSGSIANNSQVPEEKKSEAIETTANAVTDGLKQNFSLDNMGNLMNLFKGGSSVQSNPVTSSIQSTVANALSQKVGLSSTIATAIAATVVPMVMKAIAGKVNDPNEKGFDLQNLMNAFGGTENKTQSVGNEILGGLGKLFGK